MDKIDAAIERAKSGGSRTPLNFFKWDDKETKVIRFLTEGTDVYLLNVHEWVPCQDGKHRSFICRKEVGEECELCENPNEQFNKKRELGFALAVLREPVYEDVDGRKRQVSYQDYTEEYEDEEGNTKIRPWVGIVRQAPSNFWSYISAVYEKKGSLRGLDLEIMRKGADKNTTYVVFPGDPVVEIPNIDERYAKFTPDLGAMLEGMGSKDYYNQHLHGISRDKSDNGGSSSSAPSPAASSDSSDLDEETEFERLKAAQAAAVSSAGDSY